MVHDKYNSLHYLIAMLKAYGINTIVASPGTQNSCFNYLVQEDNYFRCFSVLDERSAAYIASGLIHESNKPVVITCTGATASRNYLSAMTEAFYRRIPIIALTFIDAEANKYNMHAQYLDRSVTQNDVKYESIQLPPINSERDIKDTLTFLNAAFSRAVYNKEPIHIDSPSTFSYSAVDELPNVWKTEVFDENFELSETEFLNKKTAIFIGSHDRFSKETEHAISEFAQKLNIPVFCDNTSNYYGDKRILISKLSIMQRFKNYPDLIIDIGNVTGEYGHLPLFKKAKLWRIDKFGEFKNRADRPLLKLFRCCEKTFFDNIRTVNLVKSTYYDEIKELSDNIVLPDLPLSNALISQELAKNIPNDSSLNVSILNSLRNINFFDFDKSIDINCNVGGFGIDGPVSTLIGQSLNNINKKCFGLIGDTAFFYDMNVIGNRHVKNNVRILLVNNAKSVEFRLPIHVCQRTIGDKADELIAAANHNKGGAKGWAESCGFEYITSNTKEDFLSKISDFCKKDFDKPVLFEVYISTIEEQEGLEKIIKENKDPLEEGLIDIYHKVKKIIN